MGGGVGETVADGAGYEGVTPGPLLQAKLGDEIVVHFVNELSEPTTIHWHGLRIPDAMDGTPRVQAPVMPGEEFVYRFTPPEAGSFWYHPHVNANQQIERGLYAPLVIHDPADPSYDLERYLVLDDVLLNANGSRPAFLANHMEQMHGRYGNMLLTNGVPAGELRGQAAQGQVERWRLVNSANARTMKLTIEGASARVIGTDGGLLPVPYAFSELVMPVGQRFDVEVSYDGPGPVTIQSHVLALDDNDEVVEIPIEVFAVDVAASDEVPRAIDWPLVELPARAPEATVELAFDAVQGTTGIEWRINGASHASEPVFTFTQGQTIAITLRNLMMPEHPFHLHGFFFQVLSVNGEPPAWRSWEDVINVPPRATVRIVPMSGRRSQVKPSW